MTSETGCTKDKVAAFKAVTPYVIVKINTGLRKVCQMQRLNFLSKVSWHIHNYVRREPAFVGAVTIAMGRETYGIINLEDG